MPEALELPTDHPRPPVSSLRGAWMRSTIPSGVVGPARRARAQRGRDAVHGAARRVRRPAQPLQRPGRRRGRHARRQPRPADLDGAIGVFVDTVVLRVDLSGEITFRERSTGSASACSTRSRISGCRSSSSFAHSSRSAARTPSALPGDAHARSRRGRSRSRGPRRRGDPDRPRVRADRPHRLRRAARATRSRRSGSTAPTSSIATTIERMQAHFLRLLDARARRARPADRRAAAADRDRAHTVLDAASRSPASTRSPACTSCSRRAPPRPPTPLP